MNLLPGFFFATNETGLEVQNLLAQAPADLWINTVLRQQTILPVVNNFGVFFIRLTKLMFLWSFSLPLYPSIRTPTSFHGPTSVLVWWQRRRGIHPLQKSITWGGHRLCLTCWKDGTGEKLPKSKGVWRGDQKALWKCHRGTRVRAKMLDRPPRTSNSDIFPGTSRKLVILH